MSDRLDFIMKSVSTSEYVEFQVLPGGDMHQRLTDAGHKGSGQYTADREVFSLHNSFICSPAGEAMIFTTWFVPAGDGRIDITVEGQMNEGDLEILQAVSDE